MIAMILTGWSGDLNTHPDGSVLPSEHPVLLEFLPGHGNQDEANQP